MNIKSRFRKLFWIRIGIGLFLFLSILTFCINRLRNPDEATKQTLVLAFLVLCFLAYASIDLFKVFSLNIEKNGIEKTLLLFRTKQYFSFDSVLSIERQKATQRNVRNIIITDGYHLSVLKFKTGKSLIISPDSFENYEELMLAIKNNLE